MNAIMSADDSYNKMTPQEAEIVRRAAALESYEDIARGLGITGEDVEAVLKAAAAAAGVPQVRDYLCMMSVHAYRKARQEKLNANTIEAKTPDVTPIEKPVKPTDALPIENPVKPEPVAPEETKLPVPKAKPSKPRQATAQNPPPAEPIAITEPTANSSEPVYQLPKINTHQQWRVAACDFIRFYMKELKINFNDVAEEMLDRRMEQSGKSGHTVLAEAGRDSQSLLFPNAWKKAVANSDEVFPATLQNALRRLRDECDPDPTRGNGAIALMLADDRLAASPR